MSAPPDSSLFVHAGLAVARRAVWPLALALLLTACPRGRRPINRPGVPTTGDAQARERFLQMRRSFERDGEVAPAEFEAIAQDYPDDPIAPYAGLYAGIAAVRAGDYAGAAARLEKLSEMEPDDQVERRRQLFLGVALNYMGEHERAVDHLRRGRKGAESDDERAEWAAAMAESIGRGASPLEAAPHYDAWYELARPSERAYIVSRLRALVGTASADAVRQAYKALGDKDTPSGAILGARVAGELAAAGQVGAATEVRRAVAATSRRLGLRSGPRRVEDGDPGTLGAVLPLSGRRGRAGDLVMRGLALPAGTFSGGPRGRDAFEVTVRDSRSEASAAGAAVEAVAAAGAIGVVGPIDGDSVERAGERADALGVPLISLDPRSDRRGAYRSPYVFHIVQSAESRARALARHAHDGGVRKLAILRPDSGYGRAVAAAFRAEIERLGGQIVVEQRYKTKATSFGAVVKKLARKKWDAVFIPEQASRLELVAPALAAENLLARPLSAKKPRRGRKILMLSTAEFIAPRYLRGTGRYSEGAILAPGFYPDRRDKAIGAFVRGYQAAFGRPPTALDAYAHDAATLIRRAVRDGAATRSELSVALAASRFIGLTGTIEFDGARRRADRGLLFTVVKRKAGDDGDDDDDDGDDGGDGGEYAIRALRD